jgi:hypothetical protein
MSDEIYPIAVFKNRLVGLSFLVEWHINPLLNEIICVFGCTGFAFELGCAGIQL